MTSHTSIDLEHEKDELLKLCDRDRQAHLSTDVQAAISFFADSYLYARDGQVRRHTRADLERMFTDYFRDATFHEWDDLEPPIVRISSDGSMAWMMRRFRVRYTHLADGQPVEESYVYAGITIYEKRQGQWTRTANASTFDFEPK